jgi:hypothetical protein
MILHGSVWESRSLPRILSKSPDSNESGLLRCGEPGVRKTQTGKRLSEPSGIFTFLVDLGCGLGVVLAMA